jgi:hypothetical protein
MRVSHLYIAALSTLDLGDAWRWSRVIYIAADHVWTCENCWRGRSNEGRFCRATMLDDRSNLGRLASESEERGSFLDPF